MNADFLLHPHDAEWVLWGVLLQLLVFYVVWRSWSLAGWQKRVHRQVRSEGAQIDEAFQRLRKTRFSRSGQLTYVAWFLSGLAMEVLGYAVDTPREGAAFTGLSYLVLGSILVSGVHIAINPRLFIVTSLLNNAQRGARKLDSPGTGEVVSVTLAGLALVAFALFLLCCLSTGYPYSLFELAKMAQ
jgi:hypothetical protein